MRIIRFKNLVFAIAFAAVSCVAVQLGAQQATTVTGGLNGTVTDPSSAAIEGAKITLTGPQGSRVITTDGLGHYSVSGLIPGFYDVSAEKSGFKSFKSTHNEVVVGSSSLLNITLPIGNTTETVEVTASAISIDTQSTAVDTNLSDVFYNSVPLPRQVSAIFYAAPGTAGSQVAGAPNQIGPGKTNPSVGGSSGLENLYVVDGVMITDLAFGSLGTYNVNYGALSPGINLAFIKEVDVKSYGFAPQYGKAQGGIVQMVTKSGSTSYHGALGAYVGPGSWYASRKQFYQFNYQQTYPDGLLSTPHYDLAAEIGGHVPGLKNKIFFFGAFNPSLDQDIKIASPFFPNPVLQQHGPYAYSQTTLSWAGKLTFQPTSKLQFEAAAFGDPSKHNIVPNSLHVGYVPSSLSSYQWGSRDVLGRLNYTITPTWVADAAYTYNYDHFIETPQANIYQIRDQSLADLGLGGRVDTGFGDYYPTRQGTYSIIANTQKTANWLGQHTFSTGYSYDHTKFTYGHQRSGPFYPLPSNNYLGVKLGGPGGLYSNYSSKAVGALANSIFNVDATNKSNPKDATCTICPTWNGARVYASVYRGAWSGFGADTYERYHAAYGDDTWVLNRFITINGGVRWEQERIAGALASYAFTGSWSPRLGINVDPFGDRKGKVFLNYGRNYWALPLDAANRQLGNEQDMTGFKFAPVIQNGQLVVIPDNAHSLNGTPQATSSSGAVSRFSAPNFSSSSSEGILPGTKAEYENEWVIGFEREVKAGSVFKVRYIQRSLQTIIEDIGSQSPEMSSLLPPENFIGGIANPNAKTDIAVNEQEVTYTPDQFNSANPNAGQKGWVYAPPVKGCTADNDTYNSAGGIWVDGKNTPIGGACLLNLGPKVDAGPGDGIPDGFVNPQRKYQALEIEFDKRYSNHWMAVINYRFANLWGNYEGAYRNDNGQSDPGISSLFDFTAGALGLLGDQFKPGYMSTDRRTVANLFLSYSIDKTSPYVHSLKGLQMGLGLHGQSGVPLSLLGDHPAYLNQGEVPIGGRGAAGRTPANVQLDLKAEYTLPLHESKVLKLGLDTINVTNSQPIIGKVQYTQQPASTYPVVGTSPNLNIDYGRPTAFQGPFYARATLRFEF
jgi:hypothetical protein